MNHLRRQPQCYRFHNLHKVIRLLYLQYLVTQQGFQDELHVVLILFRYRFVAQLTIF